MVDIEYVQKTLNEFFGTDQRDMIVALKHGFQPSQDISETASCISDSEVTCALKGVEAKDEE